MTDRSLTSIWERQLTHEAVCAERYKALLEAQSAQSKRLNEVEASIKTSNGLVVKVLLGVAASLISALAIIFWTLLTRGH